MFLPIRGFRDLGEARPLGPPDQFQDLCALALGARRAGFLSPGGFGLLGSLGFLLRETLALPPLVAFWPLGAPFFGLARLLRGGSLRRDVRAGSATVAAFSVIVASAFVMVVNPFGA
jgi:hypothetical protein